MIKKQKVCILGLGYIGLPTAVSLAYKGIEVHGCDNNVDVIDQLNAGRVHFSEPGLTKLLCKAVNYGNLHFDSVPTQADYYIICVPTPIIRRSDVLVPDLDYVYQAVRSICSYLKNGSMIVIESTCPVGTTEKIENHVRLQRKDLSELFFAYCPERIFPGEALKELRTNDRVVGGTCKTASLKAAALYEAFVDGKISITSAKVAEFCKLAENSFRDVNIALANELAEIAGVHNVNIQEAIAFANRHPRVNILTPGVGVGGHCIPVDPWFLIDSAPENANMLRLARSINDHQPAKIVERIMIEVVGFQKTRKSAVKVALFGLTFKPNVDDVRNSPAIKIIDDLMSRGLDVVVVDPYVDKDTVFRQTNNYKFMSVDEACEHADLLALLVPHKAFMERNILTKIQASKYLDFCSLTQLEDS